jgi:HEAT repeat protein
MANSTDEGMNERDASQALGMREARRLRRSGTHEQLLDALETVERGSMEQAMLIDGFARLQDPRGIEPVARMLSEPPMIRVMAVATLSRMDVKGTTPYLLDALNYSEPEARAHAAAGLGRLGCREAIPRLTQMLDSEVDFERITAARALVSFRDPDADQAVEAARSQEAFWTRRRYPKLRASSTE